MTLLMDERDYEIMQLRAKGLYQTEIAAQLKMSQSAVSQRIQKIRKLRGAMSK